MAQAASGNPNRFITLTIDPTVGESPEERHHILAHSWRTLVKRLHRLHPDASIDYLVITEATKQGEPHLHILFRGPYIPQQWLSEVMSELAQSPIVDIRAIKNLKHVVRYVAKYVTKKPAQFGTAKRYWLSQGYDLRNDTYRADSKASPYKWVVDRRPLWQVLQTWIEEGYVAIKEDDIHYRSAQYDPDLERPPDDWLRWRILDRDRPKEPAESWSQPGLRPLRNELLPFEG